MDLGSALRLGSLLLALPLALGCSDEGIKPVETPEDDPAQLDPPPAGQGFQISTEDTVVASGEEVQDCYFYRVSDLLAEAGLAADAPFDLHRIQIAQRDGSHHMNIF